MADSIITKQELIDAQKDAQALEEVINGEPGKLVKTRLGREVYTLASVPQINTMTREEVTAAVAPKANDADVYKKTETLTKEETNALVAPKANQTDVDSAISGMNLTLNTSLSNLSTNANKYYSTLAAATADIANIALNQSVTIGETANSGLWEKKTVGATTLTKSPYDPLTQAKLDATAKANAAEANAKNYAENNTRYWTGKTVLPVFEALNRNLFNPETILNNKHLTANGATLVDSTGSIVSGLIRVKGLTSACISGLPISSTYRPCCFLNDNGEFLEIGAAIIPNVSTFKYATIPASAAWMHISLKTPLDSFSLDPNTIQFESGSTITSFVAYQKGKLTELYGKKLKADFDADATKKSIAPKYKITGKNKFDPDQVVANNYISTTNGSNIQTLGGFTTDFIDVSKMQYVCISGLGTNTGYRPAAFYDKDKNFLHAMSVQPNTTGTFWTVPANTAYFRATIYHPSQPQPYDPTAIQIEDSRTATAYEAVKKSAITEIYGTPIIANNVARSRAIGSKYLIFGDSITSTASVDSGIFNSPFGNTNWPTYAFKNLNMSVFRNYAKSGASFAFRDNGNYLYLQNQIVKAIENNEQPDIIIIACGTNDAAINLGSYDNAVSKPLDAIDKTVTLEAARVAFQSLRVAYPNAICFYCNPLQRGGSAPELLNHVSAELSRLAQRFGFILIDQRFGSGIINELEVANGAGKYLFDGLHTNEDGKKRQASYICSQVINNTLYFEDL